MAIRHLPWCLLRGHLVDYWGTAYSPDRAWSHEASCYAFVGYTPSKIHARDAISPCPVIGCLGPGLCFSVDSVPNGTPGLDLKIQGKTMEGRKVPKLTGSSFPHSTCEIIEISPIFRHIHTHQPGMQLAMLLETSRPCASVEGQHLTRDVRIAEQWEPQSLQHTIKGIRILEIPCKIAHTGSLLHHIDHQSCEGFLRLKRRVRNCLGFAYFRFGLFPVRVLQHFGVWTYHFPRVAVSFI